MVQYFDGMGNEKTGYVLGLEEKIRKLEKQLENSAKLVDIVPVCGTLELDIPKVEVSTRKRRTK